MYYNVHLQSPEAEKNSLFPYLPEQGLYILCNIEIPTNHAPDNLLLKQIICPIYPKQEYLLPINRKRNQAAHLKTDALSWHPTTPDIHHHLYDPEAQHPNQKFPF